jgi:hypothetical protein
MSPATALLPPRQRALVAAKMALIGFLCGMSLRYKHGQKVDNTLTVNTY